jgi:RNA recognition motif-containing protein
MVLAAKTRYLQLRDAKAHRILLHKMNFSNVTWEAELENACERMTASAAAKTQAQDGKSRRARAADRRVQTRSDFPDVSRKRVREAPTEGDNADRNLSGMDHDARVKTLFPKRDTQTAFVKNLSWDVSDAELANFFSGAVNARIIKDKVTGRSRGIAYVDFSEESALTAAIMRSGEMLKGRAIDVAKSRPPTSGGGGGGGRGRGTFPTTIIGGRGVGARSGRGGLGLMPRAVRRETEQTHEQAKTNADFRAFFVKESD